MVHVAVLSRADSFCGWPGRYLCVGEVHHRHYGSVYTAVKTGMIWLRTRLDHTCRERAEDLLDGEIAQGKSSTVREDRNKIKKASVATKHTLKLSSTFSVSYCLCLV
jgi:hypothetical protein